MVTHSSSLAWTIPWTEEPGGLQSMGLKKSDATEQACIACKLHCDKADEKIFIILGLPRWR